MNLHDIVSGVISSVNPTTDGDWIRYVGLKVNDDGSTAPSYADAVPISGDMQDLTQQDVQHLASLNLSSCTRAIYVDEPLAALSQRDQTGGDLLRMEGKIWRVGAILEGWTTVGWCKAALIEQLDD